MPKRHSSHPLAFPGLPFKVASFKKERDSHKQLCSDYNLLNLIWAEHNSFIQELFTTLRHWGHNVIRQECFLLSWGSRYNRVYRQIMS